MTRANDPSQKKCITFKFLSLLVTGIFCISDVSAFEKITLEPGEYLSEAFIDCAIKGNSPYSAYRSGTIQMYIVRPLTDGLEILPILNFHESGEPLAEIASTIDKKPSNRNTRDTFFRVLGKHRFQIEEKTKNPASKLKCVGNTYAWVGQSEAWLFSKIFRGGYEWRRSEYNIAIKEDGVLQLEGRRLPLKIGIDFVFQPFDYITSGDITYGYVISNGALRLYETELDAEGFLKITPRLKWTLYHQLGSHNSNPNQRCNKKWQ